MTELSEISDRDLHREQRRRRKLQKKRSRKAHGLGPRKKGMGVRIGDRDEAEKVRRGYVEAGSYVRRDGSEKLVGRDWRMRVGELAERSGGMCERVIVLGRAHDAFCCNCCGEPHHIVKRSVRRDDRLGNLANLSHACHSAEDPRKIRSGKVRA